MKEGILLLTAGHLTPFYLAFKVAGMKSLLFGGRPGAGKIARR